MKIQWLRGDNRVPLLRLDVWTKFETDRSRRSRVIDRKRKGYIQRDRPTYQPTCAKQYALFSSKGGIRSNSPMVYIVLVYSTCTADWPMMSVEIYYRYYKIQIYYIAYLRWYSFVFRTMRFCFIHMRHFKLLKFKCQSIYSKVIRRRPSVLITDHTSAHPESH